jgi:hypothetical protein
VRTWVEIFILGLRFGEAGAAGRIAFSVFIPFATFESACCFWINAVGTGKLE